MTQHAMHVCPQCGRRWPCDRPVQTRTLESESPIGSATLWPNIQYEVYWGISKIIDTLFKTVSVWLPANAIFYGFSAYNDWSPIAPTIFCIASFPVLLRAFGKVPSFKNAIETEPHAQIEPDEPDEPDEPEDTREFVGWETETHTKSTQKLEWYTPSIPIRQTRSYALALVSSNFAWIDERHLRGAANISGPNYRTLRQEWIARQWIRERGKQTFVIRENMIRRIAFDDPK